MPRRPRFRLLLACVVAPIAAAGCVSDATPNTTVPGFPWVTESEVPQTRGQLKKPSTLDLSYARWQEQLGNLPEAGDGYRRVLQAQPQSLDALLGLARLEQLAGRPEQAEPAFRKAVEAAPRDARGLDALGQFYVAERRLPEAIATFHKAVDVAPDDPVCRHHLAVALARSGDTAQALEQFTKAVGEAEAHYNVGYIYYEQGRKDLAEREFLQAVTLRPDLASAQSMLDELRNERRQQRPAVPTALTSMRPFSPTSRPVVTQTAASLLPDATRYVAPASATAPPAAVSTPASAKSTESQPDWQMPTQRDPASISEQQMQNQGPSAAQP